MRAGLEAKKNYSKARFSSSFKEKSIDGKLDCVMAGIDVIAEHSVRSTSMKQTWKEDQTNLLPFAESSDSGELVDQRLGSLQEIANFEKRLMTDGDTRKQFVSMT